MTATGMINYLPILVAERTEVVNFQRDNDSFLYSGKLGPELGFCILVYSCKQSRHGKLDGARRGRWTARHGRDPAGGCHDMGRWSLRWMIYKAIIRTFFAMADALVLYANRTSHSFYPFGLLHRHFDT